MAPSIPGRAAVDPWGVTRGRGYRILFPGLKLRGIMGYRASISLRGLIWPQPQGQPSYLFPLRTVSRRRGGKLRYQTVFIYLFIYIHLHQKRTVQGTGSQQTSGHVPLPAPQNILLHFSRTSLAEIQSKFFFSVNLCETQTSE